MVKTTSGSYLLPAKEAPASSQEAPAETKPKLEDLINDLVSLDECRDNPHRPASTAESRASTFSGTLAISSPKKGLPPDIRCELNLPPSPDAVFYSLQNFYQASRHKPMLELANGRILYLEYDVEMDRIRLFLGNKSRYACIPSGICESAGLFVIEEVYELKMESRVREVFGFKRTEQRVLERYKHGSELLSIREAADKQLLPVLHFTLFNEKLTGISSCCIKAEAFQK